MLEDAVGPRAAERAATEGEALALGADEHPAPPAGLAQHRAARVGTDRTGSEAPHVVAESAPDVEHRPQPGQKFEPTRAFAAAIAS